MGNEKTLKREYFKISDTEVIYPASVSRRFLARFLDLFLAIIITEIMIAIYVGVNYNGMTVTSDSVFSDFIYQQYNPYMMSAWSLRILLVITLCLLIPMFNKKNPGQSIGKKIMGITPLFLSERNEKVTIFIRELPIAGLFILPTIFTLILGFDVNYIHSQYSSFVRSYNNLSSGPLSNNYTQQMGTYDFIINFWGMNGSQVASNSLIPSEMQLQDWEVVIACFQQTTIYLFLFIFIVLWFSMLFQPQKRGGQDFLAKTAIVDLKTITSLSDAEYRYNLLVGNVTSQAGTYQDHPIDLNNPPYPPNLLPPETPPQLPPQENSPIENDQTINNENLNSNENKIIVSIPPLEDKNKTEDNLEGKEENKIDENNLQNSDKTIIEPSSEDPALSKKESKEQNKVDIDVNTTLTIKEIKQLLDNEGIAYKSSMKKSELLALLAKEKK